MRRNMFMKYHALRRYAAQSTKNFCIKKSCVRSNEVISFQTKDSLNNNAVKDLHVAEDHQLENVLKRGREYAKEVVKQDRSDRARVKVIRPL